MKINFHTRTLNDAYKTSLTNYEKRYEVFYGGAGSGKSHFVAQKLVLKALKDKRKILVLRKVGRTVKESVFQMLIDTLMFFGVLPHCKVNRTDYSITLPNGSVFLCQGCDNQEKLRSITGLTDAWLEEATDFLQDDFNQVDLRIRHPHAENQQIILSFNPVSKANYCYKLFFKEEFDTEEEKKQMLEFRDGVNILHTNYKHNKFLPQKYVESILMTKATNPAYYKIYALGNFGSLDKLVFNNWQVQDFDSNTIKGELMVGLDFGYVNDITAIICSLLDEKNKRIYVFNEFGATGLLNDAIATQIKDMGLAKSMIVADSAEQKSIEEIKREGIYRIKAAVKGQGSVLQGIQKLQQYEIVIHPSCKGVLEEFQNYSWKKDRATNEYINEPEDKFNHYCDALRYSLQCVTQAARLGNRFAAKPF